MSNSPNLNLRSGCWEWADGTVYSPAHDDFIVANSPIYTAVLADGGVPIIGDIAIAQSARIRQDRAQRLSDCDWTQMPDSPLTVAQKTAWANYRQALRDVTKQAGFPAAIDWPVAP